MNYTALKTMVQDMASNYETSFVAHLDEFIRFTEKRIIQDVDIPLEQQTATLTAVIGNNALSLVGLVGFIAVDSIALDLPTGYVYLDNKDEEYLRQAFPNAASTGQPRLYCIYDPTTLKIAPTPAAAYTLSLRYSSYPESITTAPTGTTWLGDNFEWLLVYGVMRDAAVYLKEEVDVVQMYEVKYAEALKQINDFGAARAVIDKYRMRGA